MARISEIVAQNPWWTHGKMFHQYDSHLKQASPIFFTRRDIELETGNIYILRGTRQAGKTTYLKALVRKLIEADVPPKHILYLSVDSFTSRRELRNAINYFLDSTLGAEKVYILLDEITSLPDWNLELKYLADQGVTQRSVLVATGSSAVGLKKKGELLPGRGLEGNENYVKPLTFRQFVLQTTDQLYEHYRGLPSLDFVNSLPALKSLLSEVSIDLGVDIDELRRTAYEVAQHKRELQYLFGIYLITGGFPGVINRYLTRRFKEGEEKLQSTHAEVFVRNVLGDLEKQHKQEILARQILKEILSKYGSRYSFSALARDTETTHTTTMDYLESLEQSFVLTILYSYDLSKKEPKFKGNKKVYFLDPLIYHSLKSYLTGRELWEVITDTLQSEELQSKIVEGIVSSHLLMHREIPRLRDGNTFLWFYYNKSGREIDNVLGRNKADYLGIEVKYQSSVDERDIIRTSQIKNYILLSKDDVGGRGKLLIIPVDIFLSLLPTSDRNI